MKKILYLDMDNVLVDFASAFTHIDAATKEQYADHLDDVPGLFAHMQPMPGAVEAFHALAEVYDVYILSTAPWKNTSAWSDKLEWVKRHLGDKAHKRLILTHHKHLNHGAFLVDDRMKNGADRFKGKLVLFGSERFPDWASVTSYLMDRARPEPEDQHWLTLEQAIAIAVKAHRGVTDKAGSPYILHPLRIMNALEGEDERMVAVLHDVLEDCEHTPWSDLVRRKLDPRLLQSLKAVTKTPEEERSGNYMAFIHRLEQDPIARTVKLADLRDNLNVLRLGTVSEKDKDRLNKYLEAFQYLSGIIHGDKGR